MLRTSSYTIYVPLPSSRDEVLLVHGYTGAYNTVSRSVAAYLHSLEFEPPAKPLHGEWVEEPAASGDTGLRDAVDSSAHSTAPPPSTATVELLKKRGFLTTMTVNQEVGYFARVVKKLHAGRNMPDYIVMPTYDCNLRCAYCFQDHMRTDPAFGHLLRTMSPAMADRMFAAFTHIEGAHGAPKGYVPPRRIGFFGGEPLLARNRSIVEYIMTKARALGNVSFWAVSNATELAAYEDLLGPDGIQMIQVTIDGPPEEHDKRRIYADGSGSFDRIAGNVDLALDRNVQISLRMNIDRSNIGFLPEIAKLIIAKGWHERSGFSAYTAPISNSSRSITLAELKSQYFTSWELDQALTALRESAPEVGVIFRPTDQMQARAFGIFDSKGGGVTTLKSAFCGAHTGMYIFDGFGDVYACWERTGDSSIRIGRILDSGELELNDGMVRLWRTRTPASNPTCRRCRYALHCGGGCAVLAEGRNGKVHSNHCDGFAERFRYSVAEAYMTYVTGGRVQDQARVCDL